MDTFNNSMCNVDDYFKRQFDFKKEYDWILPISIQESDLWNVNSLSALKKDLNNTKSLLNDKGQDWHEHTANINKAAFVINFIKEKIQPEILTQAWCKFYEVVSNFHLIPSKSNIRTLHLCEAPGAFISALNYYLCLNQSVNWQWTANSLNPYYEGHSIRNAVVDDRLILPTLNHWYFGQDCTGDITTPSFINDICNFAEKSGLYDLITADGSIDCLENPAEQELVVEKLHFCEFIVALSCLAPQGCFVLKKFTFFECSSICQLYILNCVFEKVRVFKPFTSRPSNSEVYVVCLGFQGSEALTKVLQWYKDIYCTKHKVAVFSLAFIPDSFLQQIEECMKYFTDLQIKAIKENLMLYSMKSDDISEKLHDLKICCANAYIHKCGIFSSSIYDSSKLFYKKKVLASFNNESHKNMKSLYFEAVGDTFNNIVKSTSLQWYDKLIDVEKRINSCFPTNNKRPHEEVVWIFPWKAIRKRMKSKNFENWIAYGKKVSCIQNSKFCDPFLLHLWNKISLDTNITIQSHKACKYLCYSEDSLEHSLKEDKSAIMENIIVISVPQKCENDPLLLHLKQNYSCNVIWCLNDETDNVNLPSENKIVYINATTWEESLHSECLVKGIFTEILLFALKILRAGDTLILCIQSILTRYSAGLIFLIISLFDKFTTLLPGDFAPACSGQLWIFKNYQNCKWMNSVYYYLKKIHEINSLGEKEILEVVPMTSLCDGSFLACLKNVNTKHLLQRLKNLIEIEKSKIEKCI